MQVGPLVRPAGGVTVSFSPLVSAVPLHDGSLLAIRPLAPGEYSPVRQLFDRLGPRTRSLRFLMATRVLSDSLLARLARVDERHGALVAERHSGGRAEPIALANVALDDDESSGAEVALVVRDDWQGRGIGRLLADASLTWAAARGRQRFIVHLAHDNEIARKLVRRFTTVTAASWAGSMMELTVQAKGE